MRLQLKILLPIILLLAALMGTSSYLSYQQSAENLREALIGNMRGEAHSLKRATAELMRGAVATVERNAQGNEVVSLFEDHNEENAEEIATVNHSLKLLADLYPDFTRVSVMDKNGKIIASSSANVIGLSFAEQEFFKKAISGSSFLSTPFVPDRSKSKEVVMVASTPIKVDGKPVGVMLGTIVLDNYYRQIVAPVSIGTTGFAYALDDQGQIVVHRNQEYILNNGVRAAGDYRQMVNEDGDKMRIVMGNNGEETIVYYIKEPISKLTLVVRADAADVFSGLSSMAKISLVTTVFAIVLGFVVVFFIVRPIVVALNRGVIFASQIAKGDLSGDLQVKRNDEIGTLADALRQIPLALNNVIVEYATLESNVEHGDLAAEGNSSGFSGEFAHLISGTNGVLSRFRMVIDSIPSPIMMLNGDFKAIYLNNAGKNLTGNDYKGKTCHQLLEQDDYNTPACAMLRAAQTGQVTTGETIARPQGKVIDISYTCIPIKGEKGKVVAFLQLVTDLTEIKKTQRIIVEVATQAQDISNRVATAAEQLSAQVEQVSSGTRVQRDRAASTATAMEEMNSTVLEVARNAGQASDQAEATRDKASEGASLVNQVITAINHVNDVATAVEQNMQELGVQAEAIGGVMNVISDIADQTNLLALNAAIEAARAGEAGRGFAVVADEVRKLAEKTMEATTQVGASITGIQTATTVNIARVGESAAGVGKATALATTSGEALQEILDLASANSVFISSIATAAEEQSATSEEINVSIEEINNIAGDTSSGMEQSASAVQDLSHMAQELRTLLDKLRS